MWGEIEDDHIEEVANDDEVRSLSYIMEQARKKDCLSMYQIGSQMNENREVIVSPMHSQIAHAMTLHRYVDDMTNVINDAELAVEFNLLMPPDVPDTNIPETPIIKRNVVPIKPFNFLEKRYNKFSVGIGPDAPNISDISRRQVQLQCITSMVAQLGFKSSTIDVLDILTDIFEAFMKCICKELRLANDSQLGKDISGFPDIIENVFCQFNLGGIRGVLEYYENRLNSYQEVLVNRSQDVLTHYESLLTPNNMPMETNVERGNEIDNEDIPEVHFTTMDGEEGYLQPFLESGFQMLNSLEEGQYAT